MFKRFFSRGDPVVQGPVSIQPDIDDLGLYYPQHLSDNEAHWQLAGYLEQLFDEDYLSPLGDRWLLPWDSLYDLLDDPEHVTSLGLLGLPAQTPLQPQLASTGSLAQSDFKVFIQGWRDPASGASLLPNRNGAVLKHGAVNELLPRSAWEVIKAIRDLQTCQREQPGEATNQLGWAKVRKLALKAGAGLDGFLEKTRVIRPERLQIKPRKTLVGDTSVIELQVGFEDQPSGWLDSFDKHNNVQDRYRVTGEDGSLTHVLIEPEVKAVLDTIHRLPGRRVAGDDALSLVRNPFAVIGDAAAQVLDVDAYEAELADAGIRFHRFRLLPVLTEAGHIESVGLTLEPISAEPLPEIRLNFGSSQSLAGFVRELELKVAAGFPAGLWQGYELELSDFDTRQLEGICELLRAWQRHEAGQEFEAVIDLSAYGDRVLGIGEAERISSPFLVKETTENWLPEAIAASFPELDSVDGWNPADAIQLQQLEDRLDEARAAGDAFVCLPGSEVQVPVKAAERLLKDARKKSGALEDDGDESTESKSAKAVLQIAQNIEDATYIASQREALLRQGHHAEPVLPGLIRPEVRLREHQMQGVAWLQHLFGLSPSQVTGCLLADDMGLGKTIQLLTFVVNYLEQNPDGEPVLIIAPVSLLDNWEQELRRFFFYEAIDVLKLYGSELRAKKFSKSEMPDDLRARGIFNLLRPGWLGSNRVVLTTYETLRDQEMSLARQHWAMVICDEAQKIKNPASMVSQSARAIPARFRVACTGTPVENTLVDLWCLFDFIQPGLLGALNQFGREYLRPIEATDNRDFVALERLRALIEPQTLRRTKQDVAKDLPAKIEDDACRSLPMHSLQRDLYMAAVGDYTRKKEREDALNQRESGMLGLLHTLKLVCAHPYGLRADQRLREHSPKLRWLFATLDSIRSNGRGDKVIVFTDLRDIQRELQHVIQERFGLRPVVINGDTSTHSQSAQSRQKLIDRFQAEQGFSVIILSPIAVGFGVNVQAANHVIHFTRCWNPAKEDQATDRAYRIGQSKDVYVYYPTVRDERISTFEATLDGLLHKRRALARDMLQGAADLRGEDFEVLLQT